MISERSLQFVEVADALTLLDDVLRSPEFAADLVAIAVETDSTDELEKRPCLVLEDGTRVTPGEAVGLGVLLPEEVGSLWGVLKYGPTTSYRLPETTGMEQCAGLAPKK